MRYIGVDPGGSGGVAIISGGEIVAHKFDGKTEHDIAAIIRESAFGDECYAVIEAVHSMPKQGVASSFKFGRSYGFLRGLLVGLSVPFEEVSPQKWQKHMKCMSKGDKNVTKSRAQQLYPTEKITHAVADAMLLATYAKEITCSTASD